MEKNIQGAAKPAAPQPAQPTNPAPAKPATPPASGASENSSTDAAQNKPATEHAPATKQEANSGKAVGAQPVDAKAEAHAAKHGYKNTGRQSHAQKISHDPAQPSSISKPTQI